MSTVLDDIGRFGVVPIATITAIEQATVIGEALLAGGLPCVEVTLRTEAGLPSIAHLARTVPSLLIGAGTALTVGQANAAVDAGARFVVTPGYDDSVVEWCLEHGVPVLPGVMTPSEMMRARSAGLETVKFFPAEAAGGTAALAAVTPVFPGLRFVPTGGIGIGEAAAYLSMPAVSAVGGSWMLPSDLVAGADQASIERLVSEAVALVRTVRRTTT